MTGRRLYDLFTDAKAEVLPPQPPPGVPGGRPLMAPLAWPYLREEERAIWNAVAAAMRKARR